MLGGASSAPLTTAVVEKPKVTSLSAKIMALGGSDTDESEQSGELGRGAFRMTGSHWAHALRRRNTAKPWRDAAAGDVKKP